MSFAHRARELAEAAAMRARGLPGGPRIAAGWSWFRKRDAGTQGIVALWCLFLLLVVLRVHGSSLPILTEFAADLLQEPERPSYVLGPAGRLLGVDHQSAGVQDAARDALLMEPRDIRIDEWGVWSQWALSQLSHDPPFPVVNTNIGSGQIMLLAPNSPVLHVTALARPSTWGYLLLGASHGFVWAWWFQLFACFTVLFLVLRDVLDGDGQLAAFGAFWYCASSYVVCWSLLPTYVTFFPALMCLAAHRLVTTESTWWRVGCAALLGLALPGFLMCSYPPWQIPLGWLFLAVLAGMLWRDRQQRWWAQHWPSKLALLLSALLLAGLVGLAYVRAALPGMQALLGSVYPGSRFHPGGGYGFAALLRGYYNFWTTYVNPSGFHNTSEAASFLHLFPAPLLALGLSRGARARLGVVGWVAVGVLVVMLAYALVGFPDWLAAATMMSRSHPPRVDIALGLASIVLCLCFLRRQRPASQPAPPPVAGADGTSEAEERSGWDQRLPLLAAVATGTLVLIHGLVMAGATSGYPHPAVATLAAAGVGGVSWCLLAGRRRLFVGLVAAAVVLTGGFFNPLSVGSEYVHAGELPRTVARLSGPSDLERPLWVCYERRDLYSLCGSLISVAGGRSLTGVHQYPQLDLWHELDPERRFEAAYNRFAHVELQPCTAPSCLEFIEPGKEFWGGEQALPPNMFLLRISPRNPRLRQLGARFAVAVGELQNDPAFAGLPLLHRSSRGGFSVFEIPIATPEPLR